MKHTLTLLLYVITGTVITRTVRAQPPGSTSQAVTTRLAEVANSFTPNDAFMGTVLVVEGSRTLLSKAYGKASLEWNIPNDPDVRFRIGSLTKQFTAALVLLAQQDGRLLVTDPVRKYLPDSPAAWEKVTLVDLLHHTSGIPDFIFDPRFPDWRMNPRTPAEKIAFIQDKPLAFTPGTQFGYSNSNYALLGLILEKVSGRPYGDLLRERLLVPLGMQHSGLDQDDLVLSKRATGYQPGPHALLPARSESMSVAWAVGGMYSTAADLLRWEQGLFTGKVLSAASLQQMTTGGKAGYGDGVFVNNRQGVQVIEHGGSIEGFNSYLSYVPARQIAVIVLANVSGESPDLMAGKLLDVTLGKPVTLAQPRRTKPITPAELAQFVGTYVVSAQLSLAITATEENLMVLASGQPPITFYYEGIIGGHPQFFARSLDAQLEFLPPAMGPTTALVLHISGSTMPGKRQ